jgi:hypothetical protein
LETTVGAAAEIHLIYGFGFGFGFVFQFQKKPHVSGCALAVARAKRGCLL